MGKAGGGGELARLGAHSARQPTIGGDRALPGRGDRQRQARCLALEPTQDREHADRAPRVQRNSNHPQRLHDARRDRPLYRQGAGGSQKGNTSLMNSTFLRTAGLLIISNTFMTFAWYAHLKNLSDRKWYIAAILSWVIAFFEYMFMVPANRIGSTEMSLAQLEILQEVITLTVFVPFVVLYMRQPIRLDFLWAALCILAAVFFMFRSHGIS